MIGSPLNGRHVLAMFAAGFGLIIAVNVTLAVQAVRTFPGLEVANSYVESQSFQARRAAQEALGWRTDVTYAAGTLRLSVRAQNGKRIDPAHFTATIGRPTTRSDDATLMFDAEGDAHIDLEPGRWRLDLRSSDDHAPFMHAVLLDIAR
ncbi:FixH family protein [Paracoccus sp. TK19116]|uniref:FixH family protein n=1 Tax=Paracoccus albicereus TaxID=2922394 RepID=A0ABT1MUZ1_9RHOB|nr:FixH family protein [Paracoccus albicereus]MCQ0972107.1 FixH family protein [Paracoccus albicereus]